MKLLSLIAVISIVLAASFDVISGFIILPAQSLYAIEDPSQPQDPIAVEIPHYNERERRKRDIYDYGRRYDGFRYIFPRDYEDNYYRREYRPVVRYRSTHQHKRKKLFVPNLFG